MGDKISVIVPVYNVEMYLEKCIDSIINQTYKNLEIILVNDGSTDNSGSLCDKIASKDDRIVVYHKENGGLSDARNFGISKSTADYIGFIDSDDYIDKHMYEVLLRNMNETKSDMSMCGHYDVYEDNIEPQVKNIVTSDISVGEAIKMVLEAKILSVTAVNKLYKKSLFENLLYEKGRIAEDAFIILKLLSKCSKVVYTNEKMYYYIHRSNSITTAKFSNKFLDVIDAYEQNYNIIMEKYPELEYQARTRLIWAYFYVLDRYLMDNKFKDSFLESKLIKFLKHNKRFIIQNNLLTKQRKIAYLFLLLNIKLYMIILKMRKNEV